MTVSRFLAGLSLLACLSAPALAKDTPAAAFAAALVKAREDKTLESHVFPEQAFQAEIMGNSIVLVNSGKIVKNEISFTLHMKFFGSGMGNMEQTIVLVYGQTGVLKRIEQEQSNTMAMGPGVKKTKRVEKTVLTITGAKWKRVKTSDTPDGPVRVGPGGAPPAPKGPTTTVKEGDWDPDWVPSMIFTFVAPVLHAHLPKGWTPKLMEPDRLGSNLGGRANPPGTYVLAGIQKTEVGKVMKIELGGRDPFTAWVSTEGKTKGKLVRLVGGNAKMKMEFKPISKKELAKLKTMGPIMEREGKAKQILMMLRWAQDAHKRANGGKFADNLDDLAKGPMASSLKLKDLKGYMIVLRVAPNGSGWMAVAVPETPGKSGRYFFVTNHDGKTFQSKKEIPLADDCLIPPGLKKVGF